MTDREIAFYKACRYFALQSLDGNKTTKERKTEFLERFDLLSPNDDVDDAINKYFIGDVPRMGIL